jgi:hypothetical protein
LHVVIVFENEEIYNILILLEMLKSLFVLNELLFRYKLPCVCVLIVIETLVDDNLIDPNQYLFLVKEMQVKSEFKIHRSVVYLDKNIQNVMGNKYLLSLGYDDRKDSSGNVVETALVFKIWDFISLDNYIKDPDTGLTGGSVWEKHRDPDHNETPVMYKIMIDDKHYLEQVKKFAVSGDGMLAGIVMHTNQIIIYKIFDDNNNTNTWQFVSEKKFIKDEKRFKHLE